MSNTLKTRYLVVKLILADKVFNGTSNNVKIIKDLTMDVSITKTSGLTATNASVIIYGMKEVDCRLLSRLQLTTNQPVPINRIEIYAGYELQNNGLPPLIYSSYIWLASIDKNDPSRPFRIYSILYSLSGNSSIFTTEIKGTIGLNEALQNLVNKYNTTTTDVLIYSPNNVVGTIENISTGGTLESQLNAIANPNGYIIKWDYPYIYAYKDGYSPIKKLYTISANTGMLGYPVAEDLGISVRIRHDPIVQWGMQVEVLSTNEYSDTENKLIYDWFINAMTTTLQNRGDKWESVLKLNTYNRGVV